MLLFAEDDRVPVYILIKDKLLSTEENVFMVYVEGVKLWLIDWCFTPTLAIFR